jgi:hypothetical protein
MISPPVNEAFTPLFPIIGGNDQQSMIGALNIAKEGVVGTWLERSGFQKF